MSGGGAVTVSWTVGANGGDPITGFWITGFIDGGSPANYTVYAGDVGSTADPTPGANDSDVLALPAETDYTFEVTSGTAFGVGTPSSMSNSVDETTAPAPPLNASASATATAITLQWTVGADNGLPITGFSFREFPISGPTDGNEIDFTLPAGNVGSSLDPTPGAIDSAVVPDTAVNVLYEYSIAEVNADGTGDALSAGSAELQLADLVQGSMEPPVVFDPTLVGDISNDVTEIFNNEGSIADHVTGLEFVGVDPDDFVVDKDTCQTVVPEGGCEISFAFLPGAIGDRTATLILEDQSTNPPRVTMSGTGVEGYYEATANGAVHGFGEAPLYGDASADHLANPIVSIQATGDDGGYWLSASDGGIFAYGDAGFFGSAGSVHLNRPIVGMAVTPDDGGYWQVASDGGIFAYGDAPYYGSTGAIHLNKPIVGMATTPDGGGYWLVASDGGIFAYGDAPFYGSTGAISLNKPIVGMATTPDGGGYWLVASDGGIFAYGDAQFHGSTGSIHLNRPIIGMAAAPDGQGYWLTASDGGIFNFGDAPFDGSAESLGQTDFVGVASTAPPTLQSFLDLPALRGHDRPRDVLAR